MTAAASGLFSRTGLGAGSAAPFPPGRGPVADAGAAGAAAERSAGARRAELARRPPSPGTPGPGLREGHGRAGLPAAVSGAELRGSRAAERNRGGRPVGLRGAFVFDFCRSHERL